jgi:hypothetical protein
MQIYESCNALHNLWSNSTDGQGDSLYHWECNILVTHLLGIAAIYTPFVSHAIIHTALQYIATILSELTKFLWAVHALRANVEHESPEFPLSHNAPPPRVDATDSSQSLLLWSVLQSHKTGFL